MKKNDSKRARGIRSINIKTIKVVETISPSIELTLFLAR
jgi:hypothetical protein